MKRVTAPRVPAVVDTTTKQIIHGLAAVDRVTGRIQIRIPMKLEGTNAGMWGSHWSRKSAVSSEWETRLKFVMADFCGRDTVAAFHPDYVRAFGLEPVVCETGALAATLGTRHRCDPTDATCRRTQRVIQIRRLCPSRRNFTRDDDHTPMAQKPLLDAIKRLRLIRDDSRNWVELRPLTQEVSPDGRWWTEIEITPAHAEKASF